VAAGGNVGIGFAVPVNTVKRSVVQIIKHGRVMRGRIGLRMLGDEPGMHLRNALGLPPGVIVYAVEAGSGAEQAGIRHAPPLEFCSLCFGTSSIELGVRVQLM
jgi:serine protease Do